MKRKLSLAQSFAPARMRINTTATVVNFIAAIFLVACANGPLWGVASTAVGPAAGRWFLLTLLGIFLVLIFNTLFSLFSFPPLHKPLLISVLGVAAMANYYMDSYHIVINSEMMTNLFETDWHEASEQISFALFERLTLLGVLPALLLLLTKIRYRPWRRELFVRSGVIAFSAALGVSLVLVNLKVLLLFGREHRELRMYVNPTYPLYSFFKTLRNRQGAGGTEPLRIIAADATTSARRMAVVYVAGETARAEEFSLNGYYRQTNPNLATRNVISFQDVQACGTDTAAALPGMFSHLGRGEYSAREAKKYENLLDVLKRAGVNIVWRDNNSGSKGIADRIKYENLSGSTAGPLTASSGECYDEILLEKLDQLLRSNEGPLLIVLHQKGSHGPSYYKRTPPQYKVFLPEADREDVQNCDRQSLVNAYDNTILYTDYLLSRLIDLLAAQAYPTAMLYVSDHGESLGENNVYLHGLPRILAPRQQVQIPMIFWASPGFYDAKRIDPAKLAASRSKPYSHQYLFHSMLGLFDVQTGIYQTNLDLFYPARR